MEVRKVVVSLEKTFIEGEKNLADPWILVTAAVVVKNPHVGMYQQDLTPMVNDYSMPLAELLIKEIIAATGWDLREIEAVGKAAGVGLDAEIEHGSAIIHHKKFGNTVRERVCGTAPLVSAELRIAPANTLWIPLKHKDDHRIRSHHMSTTISVPDAPKANEILIAVSVAKSGRPLARIGNPQDDIV